eukprot:05228_6
MHVYSANTGSCTWTGYVMFGNQVTAREVTASDVMTASRISYRAHPSAAAGSEVSWFKSMSSPASSLKVDGNLTFAPGFSSRTGIRLFGCMSRTSACALRSIRWKKSRSRIS